MDSNSQNSQTVPVLCAATVARIARAQPARRCDDVMNLLIRGKEILSQMIDNERVCRDDELALAKLNPALKAGHALLTLDLHGRRGIQRQNRDALLRILSDLDTAYAARLQPTEAV